MLLRLQDLRKEVNYVFLHVNNLIGGGLIVENDPVK